MTNPRKDPRAAIALALICVGLWALIPVVAKLGQQGLDHHQFLFWSSLVSAMVLWLTAALFGKASAIASWTRLDLIAAAGLGLLGTYVYYLLLYFAYAHGEGLEVLVLQYSWPIFVVLLSVAILGERLTAARVAALAFGLAGSVVVLTKGDLATLRLDSLAVGALVVLAAFVFALFSVLSKKIELEPLTLTAVYFTAAAIASGLSMLVFSAPAWPPTSSIPAILVNGILVNGFSYVAWIAALKQADASSLAPLVFLSPVLAAILLVIFFGAASIPAYAIGLVLVVAAGLIGART